MSYADAKAALDPIADPAARLAHATQAVYRPLAAKITYFDLRTEVRPGVPRFPKAKVNALAAVVAQHDPLGHQFMLGERGIDPNHADAAPLLDNLPDLTGQMVTAADCDAIRDMARTPLGPRHRAEWGLDTFTADTLARLDDWARWEALVADVDAWVAAVATHGPVLSALGVGEAERDRLVAAVQRWRGEIEAGRPADAMPATAAAVLGRA